MAEQVGVAGQQGDNGEGIDNIAPADHLETACERNPLHTTDFIGMEMLGAGGFRKGIGVEKVCGVVGGV